MALQIPSLWRHSSIMHVTQFFSPFVLLAAFVQGCVGFGCCRLPVLYRFIDDARNIWSDQFKSVIQARGPLVVCCRRWILARLAVLRTKTQLWRLPRRQGLGLYERGCMFSSAHVSC